MKRIKFTVILFLLFSFASSGIANEDIFLMAEKGDIGNVKKIIAETKDIDTRDENGATPLHIAAKYGFTEIVELLINASADVNAKDKNGITPLHYAISRPREYDEAFHTDLFKNKVQTIKFLLAVEADVNAQDNKDLTPLMYFSALYKDIKDTQLIDQILEMFNESNVNLNAQDVDGMTALSWASSESNENVVTWLIQNKADVNLKDNNGMTALHWTAMEGGKNIAQMLLNAGADVNAKNNTGANALWCASVGGNLEILLDLLKHGTEVNIYAEGMTPLHAATGFGVISIYRKNGGESFQDKIEQAGFSEDIFLQMTKALVNAGADVYAQSYPSGHNPSDLKWYEKFLSGGTAFDYARDIGSKKVADYLKSIMDSPSERKLFSYSKGPVPYPEKKGIGDIFIGFVAGVLVLAAICYIIKVIRN